MTTSALSDTDASTAILSGTRAELHADALVTGVEGGIGYWAKTQTYHHHSLTLGGYTRFPELVITPIEESFGPEDLLLRVHAERGETPVKVTVREEDIALGCELFIAHDFRDYHQRFAAAYRADDWSTAAMSLDAIDADIIIQLGIFGRVRLS